MDTATTTPQTSGSRLRPQITMTVHPDTVDRIEALCAKFRQSRGRLVDRLVLILHAQYETGQVHCLTGEPCRFNRRDVPEIF
jgi:hypothetical protein